MIKVKDRKLLLLPGDGIGPEVVREVRKIIEWFNKNKSLDFKIEEGLVGGASYEKYKNPITDEVFYKALESEAVILGAVGGPKYDNLEFSKRPERALLKLRKELKLFANLRPAICFKQLVERLINRRLINLRNTVIINYQFGSFVRSSFSFSSSSPFLLLSLCHFFFW